MASGKQKPDNRSILEKGYDAVQAVVGGNQWANAGDPAQNRGPTNTHGNVDKNHAEQTRANPLDFTGTMSTISKALEQKKK